MQIQIQNPHTGNWELVNLSEASVEQLRGPQPQPIRLPNIPAARANHGHPLIIAGIVIGVFFGLLAALPPAIRGWVVLGVIAGTAWLVWASLHDQAAAHAYAGTNKPVPAHYSDYAPRAELVRLPNK